MAKKVYKIKFNNEESKDVFLRNSSHDVKVIDEKRKSVILKAKNKDKVRDIMHETGCSASYNEDFLFGFEDEDYSIKKIADSEEEYEDEYDR